MSRQLRNLLKQIRTLEEKIYYDTKDADWRENLLTSPEISEALTRLGDRIINSESRELSILKMLDEEPSIQNRPMPAFEKNALQVVEIIFNYLRENTNFDVKYYHVLNALQLAFTRLALNDLSFLDNPRHIAIKFVNKLLRLGRHFDKDAGRLARMFINAIETLVDRLSDRPRIDNKLFVSADRKLEELFDSFNEKATQNLNKILIKIDRESRKEQANQYTEQLIKSKTQGEEMPIFLLDFFTNLVSPLLHRTISEHGVKSKQCQQLLTDMDTLTWSIIADHRDSTYIERYEADAPGAMKRIYQLFDQFDANTDYVQEFFIEAEEIHSKKLRGERVHYDVMIAADIFADEEYEKDEKVYWFDELDKAKFDINSLEEGNWFYLVNEDKKIRCQLLMINQLARELIFINLSGELVATVAFEETEYLSNNLYVIPDDLEIVFQHGVKALNRNLNGRLELLKHEFDLLMQQRARQREEKQRQEAEVKAAIQRRLEEERARELRRKQEEIDRQTELEAEKMRQEERDARLRFQVKGIFRKLSPGAVVAYQNDDERWVEASLMLISKTTQRYIFTDTHGKPVIEPSKDELMALIGDNRIKVLQQSNQAQDPLSSLVRERRQKLSQM